MRAAIEIGDIFRTYGKKFIESVGGISDEQYKTLLNISLCRTSKLGGNIRRCGNCGYQEISYNSCRNRHCPKCQALPSKEWLRKQEETILPIQYYHIIFTLPNELNRLLYYNKKKLLDIFFKSVGKVLTEQSIRCNRHLGAKIGVTSILHTWGQQLSYHPHIHCLVSAGGLTEKNQWKACRYAKYFLPVKLLSLKFKELFLTELTKMYNNNNLTLRSGKKSLIKPATFKFFISQLYQKKWVVFCTEPINKPEKILKYFSRYSHRVAISNYRIVKSENDYVTFTYKDYNDNNRIKKRKLHVFEFIRRFLWHVLPKGFMKIRYYGILANRYRNKNLQLCRMLLRIGTISRKIIEKTELSTRVKQCFDLNIEKCPECAKGIMKALPKNLADKIIRNKPRPET